MYIYKDVDGSVILCYKKPRFKNGHYLSVDGKYFNIDSKYYPWDKNGEPIEVDIHFT